MLLSVTNVCKSFGIDPILTDVSFRLDAREKVALVGRNGTGKTTLLRILTGQMERDGGSVQLARGAKVGYLRQEERVDPDATVLEEAQRALEGQLAMRARLDELEAKMEQGPSDEDLEEFALLHERFVEQGGYSAERDIRVVLQRMGFAEEDFERPAAKLSGGEKTRLALARLLLEEPDLLILDEPTNHLDLQATEWLEGWVRAYHGAVLLVSHDRTFLQNACQRVLELRGTQIQSFPGDFAQYLRLRAEEDARLAEQAAKQEQEIAKLDEYVRRFMNSQRTAQARGRLKLMNKLIEEKVDAPHEQKGMRAGFGKASRSGADVVVCEGLKVGFPGATLIESLDWTVRWGERWGVIGDNGAGKSTLIKVLLGKLQPLAGRGKLGSRIHLGYFAQDVAGLDLDMSPLDYMVWEARMDAGPARDLLGRFLFTGDDVFRPIRSLSGGEKNKLSLAYLTQQNPNLLVLDEPTNHLDIDSREALAEVLKEYRGTLILISHDRWLLSQVTERTLDIRRTGPVIYPGSYPEYRAWLAAPGKTADKARKGRATATNSEGEEQRLSPREISKEIVRVQKLVDELEELVAQDEFALKRCEETLAHLPTDADVLALTMEHSQLGETLAGRLAAWEEQSLKLESLRAMQG